MGYRWVSRRQMNITEELFTLVDNAKINFFAKFTVAEESITINVVVNVPISWSLI